MSSAFRFGTNTDDEDTAGSWSNNREAVRRGENNSWPVPLSPASPLISSAPFRPVDSMTHCWTVTLLMMSKGPSLTGVVSSRAHLSED